MLKLASVLDTERALSHLYLSLCGIDSVVFLSIPGTRFDTFDIGALVSCFCLILSHTLSAVIVPALAAYALILFIRKAQQERWVNLLIFFIPFAIPVLALILPQVRGYLFSGWGRNEWQRSPLYIVLTLVHGVSIPIAVAAFFWFRCDAI